LVIGVKLPNKVSVYHYVFGNTVSVIVASQTATIGHYRAEAWLYAPESARQARRRLGPSVFPLDVERWMFATPD